jgi:transcriptional regulator with XRE-family HTH domain
VALECLVDTSPDQESIRSRFRQILDSLLAQGTTQQAIAAAVGVPPQYLSDLKLARKNVTELFARRLAEGYRFDYGWLMTGEGHPPQFLTPGIPESVSTRTPVRLPIFDHPICGPPEKAPEWDGSLVELSGAAAAQASTASMPYIVRFAKKDTEGRLWPEDLVLVSQCVNAKADIHVVQYRRRCYFARRTPNGTYCRIATDQLLGPEAEPVGHCVGIVWGLL